ncbi:MAG: diaminopimelate epimerase [Clostridiales bacterium]|nr:diaminopimelate epimerase [Clostridiales bacterium]
MRFTKMHGAGNDYIYVDAQKEKITNPSILAQKLSHRHFGIGGDGLVLICPSDKADFRMRMFNSDGSEAEMCGNAIRCVAKYVYDKKMTSKKSIAIETLSGIKNIDLIFDGLGNVTGAAVDMGKPIFDPKLIPVAMDGDKIINMPLEVDGQIYNVTCLSMGNPHCAVFLDDIQSLDLNRLGPKFENHKVFPKRVNTEFIKVIDRDNIELRVFERGAGETLACGTGACAAAVASFLNGYTNDEVNVSLKGGQLKIKYGNTIIMTGNAVTVFEGEIDVWY